MRRNHVPRGNEGTSDANRGNAGSSRTSFWNGRERLKLLDRRFRTNTNGSVREGDEEPAMKKLCIEDRQPGCGASIVLSIAPVKSAHREADKAGHTQSSEARPHQTPHARQKGGGAKNLSRYPPRVPKIAPTSASAEFIEDRGLMSRAREDLERSMGSRKTGSEAVSLSARMTGIESREKQEAARRIPSREESNVRGRLGVEAEKSDGALSEEQNARGIISAPVRNLPVESQEGTRDREPHLRRTTTHATSKSPCSQNAKAPRRAVTVGAKPAPRLIDGARVSSGNDPRHPVTKPASRV
ncbi:hypothetical protein B0H13DRAFT_2272723 [Mycena leptocephala]|nr:hypothetical protein B0H13DRAFT_2272723 [Mycena leptocephala]